MKQRSGFMRMLRQCEAGKIDKIICKSVSRFARNTITTLDTVRRLKDMKISVYFEKETSIRLCQSELILTMMLPSLRMKAARFREHGLVL